MRMRSVLLAAVLLLPALLPQPGRTAELPPYQPDPNALRESIPSVYRWDLTPLFADDTAWETAMTELAEAVGGLTEHRGKLGEPSHLLQALDLYFDLHDRINHCTLYANLKSNVALDDDHAAAMETRALALMDELTSTATFLRSEILALDDATLQKAFETEPGLEKHRAYLANLRRRVDRVLSPESERVLSLMGDNLWAEIDLNEIPSANEKTFGALLTDIQWPKVHDEAGEEVQMTLASYPRFRSSPDREVRREAVEAFLSTLRQYQHALAATLAGQYEFTVALSRARGYDTALQAYLDKDALDPAVYENLIDTVHDNLGLLHRYVSLRKKAMDLDEVHLYDLYRPLVEGVERDVTFPQARQELLTALQPLGEDYLEILSTGLDPANGWIDLYPHRAKRSGAFSASVYGNHPYVLMNYQNQLDDMSTLAHEYGHAVHSTLSMTHQPYSSFRYPPFLAEIASTCNEALLSDYMIEHAASEKERIYLLSDRLENIRTTIFRQTLFAEFEKTVHGFVEAGTPVTATLLDETYAGLIRRYYGDDYVMGPNDGMEWAYVPHFYYKYYVFTYATGLSSGIAIAQRLRGEHAQEAQEGLVAMLSGGCSEPPLDLLRKAGVDLTRPDAIEAAMGVFAETLSELEGQMGR